MRRARRVLGHHLDDRRPALVLDIDDTSLSNYECLREHGFQRSGSGCGGDGELPAIPQTLRLYRYARAHGVTVFFVTGRSETARAVTLANLRRAGYTGRRRLRMRPAGQPAQRRDGWKARVRRSIDRRGYRVVVNLGDQRSDLDGGHALRAFKLPNPMYVIAAGVERQLQQGKEGGWAGVPRTMCVRARKPGPIARSSPRTPGSGRAVGSPPPYPAAVDVPGPPRHSV